MPDRSKTSPRKALREATAPWHDRVDAAFSRFDLGNRDQYAQFLSAQAAAFGAVEQALEHGGIAALVPDWAARQRSPMLAADLAALGMARPAPLPPPVLEGEAALLGALYVLEGSRLGGALLRRSVPEGFPVAFLTPGDPRMWRDLIHLLDDRLHAEDEIGRATKAAVGVFSIFETAGRQALMETATGE